MRFVCPCLQNTNSTTHRHRWSSIIATINRAIVIHTIAIHIIIVGMIRAIIIVGHGVVDGRACRCQLLV